MEVQLTLAKMKSVFWFCLISTAWIPLASCEDKGAVTVICTTDRMDIRVPAEEVEWVGLEKWSEIPGCQFESSPEQHNIVLPLTEELPCGTTRVRNTATGKSLYYQRLIISTAAGVEEKLLIKCMAPLDAESSSHNIVKRELPPGFQEPDYIEITSEVTGTAPVPILGVGVRQDGSLVEGAINVHPGTPLTMEVYLDNKSAGTYGILVSFLEVTDNANKEETIVYNGCTIDPNLFENFETRDGDFLAAKFRAFKFPESNFVLFRGTVDVCLDKCKGITCSDGKIGFGRKRRSIDVLGGDPNKLFEVTMTTYIKFSENSTKSTIEEEIMTEERLRERLRYSGLSSEKWEVPLIRRSPDVPPSIAFNGGTYTTPFLSAIVSLGMFLLARLLS